MIACRYRTWLEDGRPEDLEPELADLLPALQQQARRLLGRSHDPDDAVQDALVELLRCRRRLPADVPLPVVARRLVWERAMMQARSRKRRSRREESLIDLPVTSRDPASGPPQLPPLTGLEQALAQGLMAGLTGRDLSRHLGLQPSRLAALRRRLRQRLRLFYAPQAQAHTAARSSSQVA